MCFFFIGYIVLLLINVAAHQIIWKKMYGEHICFAMLLFYLHNMVFTISMIPRHLAIFSTSKVLSTRGLMHHLLLEVMEVSVLMCLIWIV